MPSSKRHRISDVDPVVYATADSLGDGGDTSGSSAIVHVGDRLEFVTEPDGTTGIDVITHDGDDDQRWYRLRLTKRNQTVFAIQYVFRFEERGQQPRSGHQPAADGMRAAAGRAAVGDDPPGPTAGLSEAGVPDGDYDPDAHGHPFLYPGKNYGAIVVHCGALQHPNGAERGHTHEYYGPAVPYPD